VVYDKSLEGETNLVCGANEEDYHLKGLSLARDLDVKEFVDVATVDEGDYCIECGNTLRVSRGVEVGNIFQLGTTYSESMNMTYTDEDGKQKTPIMGCYGIGVGRLLACIIEDNHDEYGPIWPKSVAPWQVHICMLNNTIEEVKNAGFDLYERLGKNYEVILDDRGAAAGVQFADADLLGIPVRIIVSKRNIENGQVEIVTRDKSIKKQVALEDVEAEVSSLLK
jgi:prolyl-tRNA synthetase